MKNNFAYICEVHTKDGKSVKLRPARSGDTEIITANIQEVCAEQVYLCTNTFILTDEWQQVLARSVDEERGHLLIVAQAGAEIVGYLRLFSAWYGPRGRHVGEVGLALVGPWRERGIGTALTTYALDWASLARFHKLTVSVIATNQRALNLFVKFGFGLEGRRIGQFNIAGQYVDEILLGRFLDVTGSPQQVLVA